MKRALALLAPPLLAMALAHAAFAAPPDRVVAVDRDTMASGLIGVTALKQQTLSPGIAASGTVVDPEPAIRARGAVLRAEAGERLAAATLKRARQLYHAGGNVSEADLEAAEARAAEARAGLDARDRATTARFGTKLGRAIIDGDGAWRRIAAGDALVMVVHDGSALAAPPRVARGTAPGGTQVLLHAIGPAGQLPPGLVGQAFYFTGPDLPAGTPLDVSISGGTPKSGYAIPVSALIYRSNGAYVFAETGTRKFAEVTIPLDWPIRDHGMVAAYFVPATLLPGAWAQRAMVVTKGAGLVRSAAAGGHGPAPGTDRD